MPILELLRDHKDPPLTRETVEELEIVLGVRFPADYAEFLLQFNGGEFRPYAIFYFPTATPPLRLAIVERFLGEPGDGISNYGLTWCANTLRGRLPDDCLAIADGAAQDVVVLRFGGPDGQFSGVWYWNSLAAFDEAGEELELYWLANTFTEFVAMLMYDIEAAPATRERIRVFRDVERGNLRAVERFLEEGGSIEKRNAKGQSLLAAAVIYAWPKIVRLLLARGADPNSRDRKGRTPLHHAALHSIDSVKLLLAAGSDVQARDNRGKSVIGHWQYRADEILRRHGAVE